MHLESYMIELENNLDNNECINISVSSKPIGWHIDHILKVNNAVAYALLKSNPNEYKYSFNLVRMYVFMRNSIPRGSGKAPKTVIATEEILLPNLEAQLAETKKLMTQIQNLPTKSNFKHPYFGMLKLKKTFKFLDIHTLHHLKIIRDILH